MNDPFSAYDKIHLMGIKGVAMTALAQCLLDLGKQVSGSDVEEEFVTQHILDTLPVQVKIGFHESNIPVQTKLVVYTGAHQGSENLEVQFAKSVGVPTMSHAEALSLLMQGKLGIAVCGVGGKTTTSAMIAWILEKTGRKPSYAVGVGNIAGFGKTGAYRQDGEWFVAEADEYVTDPGHDSTPRFHHLNPRVIVCTRIAHDHPDVYSSYDAVKQAYLQFFAKLPKNGTLILSSQAAAEFGKDALDLQQKIGFSLETYGHADQECTMKLEKTVVVEMTTQTVAHLEKENIEIRLKIPGAFNVMNAAAALLAARAAGVQPQDAVSALQVFDGTMRRFEDMGNVGGIQRYDDYAHHPDEIRETLCALKEFYPKSRKIVLFQSHTYSRTKLLLKEFSQCFTDADIVFLLDIFPSAREKDDPSIHSDMLVDLLRKEGKQAENLKTIPQAAERLKKELKPGDIFMTIGAGDVYAIHPMLEYA